MPKQFLTVKEVAKLLGVTPLTVRNWDTKGKLTAHRHPMNNYRLYRVEDVENLVREFQLSKVSKRIFVPTETNSPELTRRDPVEPEKPKVKKLKIDVL